MEHLHFTALPGWYVETIYVSYIHHQLIFHELFIQRLLALLAGITESQEDPCQTQSKDSLFANNL